MEGLNSSSWESVEVNGNERESRGEEVVVAGGTGNNENFEVASTTSDEQGDGASSSSRCRVQYSRNTPHQIEQLENFFKKNPHPNERERLEIGRKLHIEMNRVKFWFQNRRTQLKTRGERHENAILKQENEELKVENLAMKDLAVKKPLCKQCGGQANVSSSIEEHKILIENARLKQELSSITTLVTHLLGRPSSSTSLANYPIFQSSPSQSSSRLQHGYDYVEQAASRAMEELMKLGLVNAPLWNKNKGMEGGGETLNFEEYARAFPPDPNCLIGTTTKPLGLVSEATRASAVVSMTSSNLVAALLDANQWKEMFVGMIGSCSTVEVICNGVGGSTNGALQLMKAEIQLVSSLVPVRVLKFIRFAKQQAEGVWAVVDLSINACMKGQHFTRRCPSGCILHDMPNGFSKVTWIEHTEYDEQVVPKQYRQLVRSGVGFGAQRWISALLRHCEGLTATMSHTFNQGHHLLLDRKRSLKSLAKRMTSIFCAAVCLTGDQQWDLVADAPGKPRIMARKCESGLGEPSGIIISATYSVWIPAKHRNLFDLLLTKELRCVWDVICHKIATRKMFHFPLGQNENSPNSISILNSNTHVHAENNQIMVLQETMSDTTGSLIVYASVDFPTVSLVMNGGDSSSVALLPSGACIVPGYGEGDALGSELGSMVTMGFQILLHDLATSNISAETISTINDLVSRTVLGIEEIVRSSRQ